MSKIDDFLDAPAGAESAVTPTKSKIDTFLDEPEAPPPKEKPAGGWSVGGMFKQFGEALTQQAAEFTRAGEHFGLHPELGGDFPEAPPHDPAYEAEAASLGRRMQLSQQQRAESTGWVGQQAYGLASFAGSHAAGILTPAGTPLMLAQEAINDLDSTWARKRDQGATEEEALRAAGINTAIGTGTLSAFGPAIKGAGALVDRTMGSLSARLGYDTLKRILANGIAGAGLNVTQEMAESYADKLQFGNPQESFDDWFSNNLSEAGKAAAQGGALAVFGIIPAARPRDLKREAGQLNEDNRNVETRVREAGEPPTKPRLKGPVGTAVEAVEAPKTEAQVDKEGLGADPMPVRSRTAQEIDSVDPPEGGFVRIYRAGGGESDNDSNARRWGTTSEQDLEGYRSAKRDAGKPEDIYYIDAEEGKARTWRGDSKEAVESGAAGYTNKAETEYFVPQGTRWKKLSRPEGMTPGEYELSIASGGWAQGFKDYGWVEQAAGGAAKRGEVRISPHDAGRPWLEQFANVLQKTLDKFKIDAGIVLGGKGMKDAVNAASSHEVYGEENGAHLATGPHHSIIYMNEDRSIMAKNSSYFTLMHEFGHMLMKHFFDRAPYKIQQALRTEYLKFVKDASFEGWGFNEIMGRFLGVEQAELELGQHAGEPEPKTPTDFLAKHAAYFRFSEWLANKFATVEGRKGLEDEETGRYFKRALAIMERAHREMQASLGLEGAFHDWVQGLAERGEFDPRIKELNEQLHSSMDLFVRRRLGFEGEERGFTRHLTHEQLERVVATRWKNTEEGQSFALASAWDPRTGIDWDHYLKVMEATDTGAFDRQPGMPEPEKSHQAMSYERVEDALDRQMPWRTKEGKEAARMRKARVSADMTYYSRFLGFSGGLLDIANKNLHIPGVRWFRDRIQQYHIDKMTIKAEAMDNIKNWRNLAKDGAGILGRALFEEDIRGAYLTPQEMQARGFTPEIKQVYDTTRAQFDKILTRMENSAIHNAILAHQGQPTVLAQTLGEIRQQFRNMKMKPYFPHSRFGDHGLKVMVDRDFTDSTGKQFKKGDTYSVTHHESLIERDNWQGDLMKGTPPGALRYVPFTIRDENVAGMRGLPPEFANRLSNLLKLSSAQEEELRNLQYKMAPHQSFMKHLMTRKGTEGFSRDAQRVYASYMQKAANGIARMEHLHGLQDAIDEMKRSARDLSERGIDDRKRVLMSQWFERLLEYIEQPKHEGASLRALGFHWFLGFNPKSAAVNLLQPVMTTYPYLAQRYGDAAAIKAMTRAYAKSIGSGAIGLTEAAARAAGFKIALNRLYSADEKLLMETGKKEGWADETQGAMLAGEADPGVFARYVNSGRVKRGVHFLSNMSSGMFRHSELFNRKISALASYELARGKGMAHADAVGATRDAVQTTQFEYAPWNRPQWMRGKKGVLFLFGQYEANMLRFAFGGDPGWWRAQLMLGLIGGAAGIPLSSMFMDLVDLVKKYTSPNQASDTAKDVEDFFEGLHIDGDLAMHGLSRYTMGLGLLEGMPQLDISSSISMGYTRFLGGRDAIKDVKSGDANRVIQDLISNWGGPYGNLGVEIVKAAKSDEMDEYRRWSKLLPSTLKALADAWRREDPTSDLAQSLNPNLPWWAQAVGGRRDKTGAITLPYDYEDFESRSEHTAKYFNFESTRVSKQMEADASFKEMMNFYQARRAHLTHAFATTYREKDREGVADAKAAIEQYNREVPHMGLKITPKDLMGEVRREVGAKEKSERGLPPGVGRKYYELYRGYTEGKQKRAVTTPGAEEAPPGGVGP